MSVCVCFSDGKRVDICLAEFAVGVGVSACVCKKREEGG